MLKLNKLYLMDCMEGMKDFPDKYFDLAIVDPPYGIGCDAIGMSNRASNSPKFKNYKGKNFKGGGWDKEPMPTDYFIELKRISKHRIIWGANHYIENIPNANSSSWIVWYKNGQNPNSTNADCELAWTSHSTAVNYFRYDWSGFGAINANEDKIHPTQKPVQLYKWLLKNYAKPDFKIIDTHAGSCSSVIAFLDFGCQWIAFEIDRDYFESATKRIENHKKLPKPFFNDPLLNKLELNKQKGFFNK